MDWMMGVEAAIGWNEMHVRLVQMYPFRGETNGKLKVRGGNTQF